MGKGPAVSRRNFLGSLAWGSAALTLLPSCASRRAVRGQASGGRQADVLLEGLRSADPVVQADSARLLGELRLPQAVGPLLDYVSTCQYYAKTAGFHALLQIGDPAACKRIAPLIAAPQVYNDEFWIYARMTRLSAALTVAALEPNADHAFLEQQLAEKDNWKFNIFCLLHAPVIVQLPNRSATMARLKQRTMERLYARRYFQPERLTVMSKALGDLGGPQAAAELEWFLRFPSRFSRGEAAYQLMRAGATAEQTAQVTRLADTDPTEYVRLKAAAGLFFAGNKTAGRTLCQMLADKPEDALLTATALDLAGELKYQEATPLAVRQLAHADPYVRLCAVAALESLEPATLQKSMVPLAADRHIRVRLQAAKSILALQRRAEA